MTDEGIPVGAARAAYYQISGETYDAEKKQTMYHVYLGQDYDDNTIEQEIEKSGLQATYHEEIEPVLAHLLAEGAVVARFNGRMEYGPRALGTARYCIGLMTHPFNIG